MATLFEMKEKMTTLQAEIAAVSGWIADKAAEPSTPMEEIAQRQARRDELTARFDLIKAEHDSMEAAQRASLAMQHGSGGGMDAESVRVSAKAAFYKAALFGGDVAKTFEGLGGIPAQNADLGYGDNLLPTNLTSELITQPVEENSLRLIEPVSQITGLEEPVLMFSIEDVDLENITDKDTANEIEMTGGKIAYGRFKTKLKAVVKDTIMHGTETNLVSTIENALRLALATSEKMNAFRTTSNGTNDHMSFYLNGIKTVTGGDLIEAIINAWSDLPETFAGRATCVMRRQDYFAVVRLLANSAVDLWGKKPEDVIGIPVIFNDRAVTPVIGDFSYSRQNYDIRTIYETDKDGDKGEYYFYVTTWGDHRIRLKNAFRLATVAVTP